MSKLDELRADLQECEKLLALATRPAVKQVLQNEMTRITNATGPLERAQAAIGTGAGDGPTPSPTQYTVPIKNYGWDDSGPSIKLYITLPGVGKIPQDGVTINAAQKSVSVLVNNLNNKNHKLEIMRLFDEIDPTACSHRVKSDMLIVTLKKAKQVKWTGLTDVEKKQKQEEKAPPKLDEDEDPQAGLMKLMKQMYDDGDDTMKQTIAKAWTESQDKNKQGGGAPGAPGLPGF